LEIRFAMTDKTRTRAVALYVGSLGLGGAQRVMLWLAESLRTQGYKVILITDGIGLEGRNFFHPDENVEREIIGLTQAGDGFICKIVINFARFRVLRAILQRHRVDVLLAMMPRASVLAILATRGSKCRVVISERNAPWHRREEQPWELMRRMFYRFSDAQVAQTQPIADWLRLKTGSRRVAVIPNAVQPVLPSVPPLVQPDTVLPSGRKLLLAVGTKPYQKGFDLLVAAFARIAGDRPEWDLAIPGLLPERIEEGVSGQYIRDAAAASGLMDRVFLPGHVGNMADWYGASDLFVLSSRFEGFPNVLVEAMSAGRACVAFACDTGPGEIIRNGIDGILVRDLTVEALAGALAQAMDDADLRARLAAAAVDVARRYAPASVLGAWCRVLGLPEQEETG